MGKLYPWKGIIHSLGGKDAYKYPNCQMIGWWRSYYINIPESWDVRTHLDSIKQTSSKAPCRNGIPPDIRWKESCKKTSRCLLCYVWNLKCSTRFQKYVHCISLGKKVGQKKWFVITREEFPVFAFRERFLHAWSRIETYCRWTLSWKNTRGLRSG